MGGLYSHHGIDLGDGTVVHLSGEPLRRHAARVCRTSLEDFLQGGKPEVVRHADTDTRPPDEVVATALAHLGEGGYDVWRNNCEHFACFCVTGRRDSVQITVAKRVLKGAAAGVTAAIVLGAVIVSARQRDRWRGISKT